MPRPLQVNIDVIHCRYTDFDILDIQGQPLKSNPIYQLFFIHLEPQNHLHAGADCRTQQIVKVLNCCEFDF
jgi:hypothetical protein